MKPDGAIPHRLNGGCVPPERQVMPEKKWFEISGFVNCEFRVALQATDEAEAKELFRDADVDIAEYIDWINDFSVSSITRSEPESGAKALLV
jgi:hypothetical protein